MESIGRLDARMLRGGAQTNLEVSQDHSKHFVCKQDSVNKSKSKSPRPEESGTSLWLNEPPDFGESGQPRLAARREHVTSRLEAPKKAPNSKPRFLTTGRLDDILYRHIHHASASNCSFGPTGGNGYGRITSSLSGAFPPFLDDPVLRADLELLYDSRRRRWPRTRYEQNSRCLCNSPDWHTIQLERLKIPIAQACVARPDEGAASDTQPRPLGLLPTLTRGIEHHGVRCRLW